MKPVLWPWALMVVAAGMLLPIQAAVTARLGQLLSGALWAVLISFIVATTGLALLQTARRPESITWEPALTIGPWWIWFGGLIGVFYVTSITMTAPRLGAATMMALIIGGQVLASLVLDQLGFLDIPVRPITVLRIVGFVLLLSGVWLVVRF